MIYRIRGHWLVAAFAITFLMRERNKRSCNNLIIARRGKFSGLKSSPHTEATDSLWLRYGLDETTRRKSIIRCARLADRRSSKSLLLFLKLLIRTLSIICRYRVPRLNSMILKIKMPYGEVLKVEDLSAVSMIFHLS